MSLLHEQKSFLETNAWQKPKLNSLRYNTAVVGQIIPIVFGTTRVPVNVIALGGYSGPKGSKGKTSALPLGGTPNTTGKGGGGSSKKGAGKYSVDVAFMLCQGPVDVADTNKVWSSAGIAFFRSVGLNLYTGEDGQAADPVFFDLGDTVGYSGTCYVTGTPLDLGSTPVLPNISFEVTGFETGTGGSAYPLDANPANALKRFLTDLRWGTGWPEENLDPNLDVLGTNGYADYCQAAQLVISIILDKQTEAAAWISELARLTNVAFVWSGTKLKVVPYGDLQLSSNGASWVPDLTVQYSFTDDDYLPWTPRVDGSEPVVGEDDPVVLLRSDPEDAINWMSLEYLDRDNMYVKTILPQFDQGAIDQWGIKTEPMVQGDCFHHKNPASISIQLLLQRAQYVRNRYRFQVGWRHSRLEPMDIVYLTDPGLDLDLQPVRVIEIEENQNGDLIVLAEEIKVDVPVIPGCDEVGDAIWRLSAPQMIDTTGMPPDRLDKNQRMYVPDPYGSPGPNHATVYDTTDGSVFATLSYGELWDKISTFTGASSVEHYPVFGDGSDAYEYYGYYLLWPVLNGRYVLAYIKRQHVTHQFSFWWALLDPDTLDVLGAYYYLGLTALPYANGTHVLGALDADQPLLVLGYFSLGAWWAALGVLPSVNEFLGGTYNGGVAGHPFRIDSTMIFPLGKDTLHDDDFSKFLFMLGAGPHNNSRNFGFLLPAADGGVNYYIYVNTIYMDYVAASTLFVPVEFKLGIQPLYPDGCMIKIPLGNVSFGELSSENLFPPSSVWKGTSSGPYEIDNLSWRKPGFGPAIPFLDERTHVSNDTGGDDDAYSLQTGVIDRDGGKFWVIFYMVGRADAHYRNALDILPAYAHPIWERVRVFEYTQSTEIAYQIAEETCYLHNLNDPAPNTPSGVWESTNDNFQIFSVTQSGTKATLYIHGALFKKPFMTFDAPISPV